MRYIITLACASAITLSPALAEVPLVVTDIPPVHALAAQVMGDLGQPELLLAQGADEHDFQLRPSQVASVADAGLVIWMGPELTPWLAGALESRPAEAAVLGLLAAEGTTLLTYAESGSEHDDHEDHAEEGHSEEEHSDEAHAEEEHSEEEHSEDAHTEEGHDDHAHDGTDPHAWLDPGNAKLWLGLIAAELGAADPENATAYTANAAAAADRIDALDAKIVALLAPHKTKPVVAFHDAYGYFAAHFGMIFVGSIALGDAATPGAARLTELRTSLEEGGVACIFPEAQHDPALVDQMAEGTSTRIGGALDPVGSSLEPGPDAYGALMRGIATTLATCLAD